MFKTDQKYLCTCESFHMAFGWNGPCVQQYGDVYIGYIKNKLTKGQEML